MPVRPVHSSSSARRVFPPRKKPSGTPFTPLPSGSLSTSPGLSSAALALLLCFSVLCRVGPRPTAPHFSTPPPVIPSAARNLLLSFFILCPLLPPAPTLRRTSPKSQIRSSTVRDFAA